MSYLGSINLIQQKSKNGSEGQNLDGDGEQHRTETVLVF
jgi:hypothetical protein